jgi:tRNA pseudouridine55 synthase
MYSEKGSVFEDGQVLLFDKAMYWTSFDLVNKVRIMIRSVLGTGKIKVGHAGTLDPLASGLMILCTGKATKRISDFMDMDKEYIAVLHIGETTPSFDLETEVDGHFASGHVTRELAENVLTKFKGEQNQVPPLYSAKFIDGKRAYEYARKGHEKELAPAKINIREAELLGFNPPEITIRLLCSKGTYVRSFARDYGSALESGAYLSSLRRTAIGSFNVKDAYTIEKFQDFLQQMKQT